MYTDACACHRHALIEYFSLCSARISGYALYLWSMIDLRDTTWFYRWVLAYLFLTVLEQWVIACQRSKSLFHATVQWHM